MPVRERKEIQEVPRSRRLNAAQFACIPGPNKFLSCKEKASFKRLFGRLKLAGRSSLVTPRS
jgi:hypothetical protein